ncbi:hypothetical protein SAMN06309944_1324 [Micrococcales bacterium KH10]|nr:hypothetical protein SAMN06309944_1324 [Micrococcales bacterium KH10]
MIFRCFGQTVSAAFVAFVCLVGIVGCSSGSGESVATEMPTAAAVALKWNEGFDPEDLVRGTGYEMSDAQRAVLADGEITYDEYQAAFQRFRACAGAAGVNVEVMGEENQVIDYRFEDVGDSLERHDQCLAEEFDSVNTLWGWHRDNWGVEAGVLAECLRERGEEPRLLVWEKSEQLRDMGVDPQVECLDAKLGPDFSG